MRREYIAQGWEGGEQISTHVRREQVSREMTESSTAPTHM
jgi:hypothetical protein